jgi:hypothetical protein
MRKHLQAAVYLSALLLFCLSCKKEVITGALSGPPANLQYMVEGSNVHISWEQPEEDFDNYTLELSKLEDFSITNDTRTIEKGKTFYIYRKLDLGETYYMRIRTNRLEPLSRSEWTSITYSTTRNNILLPVLPAHITGDKVMVSWDFSKDNSPNNAAFVTRILLTPVIGQPREIQLTPQNIQAKSAEIGNLEKDVLYTVTIYNKEFPRGTQKFATAAEPVNGVWTISPHSDLISIIGRSSNGDKILLRPGIYNTSITDVTIENKVITIGAFSTKPEDRPKLYAKGFILNGANSGLDFTGLNISGGRINEYKQELPNNADAQWNGWLIMVNGASTGFDSAMLENCIVRNYWNGIFNMNDNNRPPHKKGNLVSINNCIVYNVGGDNTSNTVSINAGELKKGSFTNSTYYKASRMFTLVDQERNPAINIELIFKNNTVDNSWSSGAFDFKAVKAPSKCLLQNNIFSNITSIANFLPNFAFVANTFEKRLINCNFYKVNSKSTIYGSNSSNMPVHTWELRHPNTIWTEVKPAFIMNDAQHANPNSIREYPVSIDPAYKDPANLDFTIPAGNALRSVDGGNAIGDPRWW